MIITLAEYLIIKKKVTDTQKIHIMSSSMEPFIHTGEEIIIKKFNPDTLKKFTPIVFWHNNHLICHFYIKKIYKQSKFYYLAKGLNSKQYDEMVEEQFILGEVIKPKMSRLRRFFMGLMFFYLTE